MTDEVTPEEEAGAVEVATAEVAEEVATEAAAVEEAEVVAEAVAATVDSGVTAKPAPRPTAKKPAKKAKKTNGDAIGVGRRKEAVARVRLRKGSGELTINGQSLQDAFPDKVHQEIITSPLDEVEVRDSFDVFARLDGGGVSGQAGALRLAIARALNDLNDVAFRDPLKKAGFLSRDDRAKERKKYGLKKARKAPQYSKR